MQLKIFKQDSADKQKKKQQQQKKIWNKIIY